MASIPAHITLYQGKKVKTNPKIWKEMMKDARSAKREADAGNRFYAKYKGLSVKEIATKYYQYFHYRAHLVGELGGHVAPDMAKRWFGLTGRWPKLKEKRRNRMSEVIKVKRSESSKFDNTLVEHLHNLTLEGFAAEELGDVQDFGWYGLLLLGDDPITAKYDDSSEKVAAAILTEDSQGFVYADTFTTEKEAKKQWSKIEDEYEEFAKEAEAEEAEEEESDW